jgi:hypothetical protein
VAGRRTHAARGQALLQTWLPDADAEAFAEAARERGLGAAAYLRMLVRQHLLERQRGAGSPEVDRLIDRMRADVIRDLRAKLGASPARASSSNLLGQ